MSNEYRDALMEHILANGDWHQVVASLSKDEITYEPSRVWVDPSAPGFTGTTCRVSDEELVRAYLLLKLTTCYGYDASPTVLEVERVYKPVGRPIGKGGRIDVIVRQSGNGAGGAFLFVECKTPETFDSDFKNIDGQLFRLSLQEQPRPKYLLYYTVDLRDGGLVDRVVLIDTTTFPDYESWDLAGQPITDVIPERYGRPKRKFFANVDTESTEHRPLDKTSTSSVFSRLREEIHDVIWGGGGTNNNEVFTFIVKLILCKIYDEKETAPGAEFRFQRFGDESEPESALALSERLNGLYREAEEIYLAMPQATAGPAFDPARLSPEKLAYVVGRLQGLSVTENVHDGDLLGEFFEQIVSQDFTQTKGQFFTPLKIVRFILALADVGEQADKIMRSARDDQGRPRLPYVIDPSCGSGTFLIEHMKLVTDTLNRSDVAEKLPQRLREWYDLWFGVQGHAWAREYIFGIENNYDLGLAAKVNMVLHGDGSMNTWISSGLLPFSSYWLDGRNNILGAGHEPNDGLYFSQANEQFDLVISNPPFSLTMSTDEVRDVQRSFSSLVKTVSEIVFIERWYQLLRNGGVFCCILPETVLDTKSNLNTRLFLYQFFRIKAVVSLPYDAFKPFTSTKTCIILAEKRPRTESRLWADTWADVTRANKSATKKEIFAEVVKKIGWSEDPIFMAEPLSIGYKRRKGLPDVQLRNELYSELPGGIVDDDATIRSVLSSYRSNHKDSELSPSARLGFWTDLKRIGMTDFLRLDPKYRWLWDHQRGVAHGSESRSQPLRSILEVVKLPQVKKGGLESETPLIDLERVEGRQGILRNVPLVDVIGSDKVRFEGCELAISKLEPYLGKVLIEPPPDALGSTEWVGLRRISDLPLLFVAHLLMLPDLCEAYRRLQSGKRHARFNPEEFLNLRVQLPSNAEIAYIQEQIAKGRKRIVAFRKGAIAVRKEIDRHYSSTR